jgi:hypothetical protein
MSTGTSKWNHGEAFCLMTYRTKTGKAEEVIWNSRDGVTPFIIYSLDGQQLEHVEWQRDRCVPTFIPPIGSRAFITQTREGARAAAERIVLRKWGDADWVAGYGFTSREHAVERLAHTLYGAGDQPAIIVVDEAFQAECRKRFDNSLEEARHG